VPKKVDHHERRTLIADALMRVAADRGLEEVSLRHVATEAGVSSGMVQHYFRTKDEMMTFALEVIYENVQARIADYDAALGGSPSPRGLVRALLIQLLPLDEPRMREGRVALAFSAYAAVRPAIANALREDTAQMREYLAEQIRLAQVAGTASTDVDPTKAATGLLALVEGLALHVIGGYYQPDMALSVFEAHLDQLFGPPAAS
jgi:AcrR family transcriptional regulator